MNRRALRLVPLALRSRPRGLVGAAGVATRRPSPTSRRRRISSQRRSTPTPATRRRSNEQINSAQNDLDKANQTSPPPTRWSRPRRPRPRSCAPKSPAAPPPSTRRAERPAARGSRRAERTGPVHASSTARSPRERDQQIVDAARDARRNNSRSASPTPSRHVRPRRRSTTHHRRQKDEAQRRPGRAREVAVAGEGRARHARRSRPTRSARRSESRRSRAQYALQVAARSSAASYAEPVAVAAEVAAAPSADIPRRRAAGVSAVLAYAHAQLGKPYCYAGVGPDCYDCSGLTMMAWAQAGVSMSHGSYDQYGVVPAASR